MPALAAAAAAAPLPPATALRRRRCPSAAARPARRSSDVARASADEGGPTPHQPLAQENPALAVERQEERALAYGALSGLLGAAGLALAAAPARVVEYLWAATPTIVVSGLAQNVGSQLLLAAIVAHCLKVRCRAWRLRMRPPPPPPAQEPICRRPTRSRRLCLHRQQGGRQRELAPRSASCRRPPPALPNRSKRPRQTT